MTDERRFALLIACSDYTDPDFRKLKAPRQDAQALAEVLKDPGIGGFVDVKIIENESYYNITDEIYTFFNDRTLNDLALVYFAGHGMKGEDSELYFVATDTVRKKLGWTGISSTSVNKAMLNSRAKRQVLILDCCNSGAFPKGNVARAGEDNIQTNQFLKGKGRVILTASDAMQYAFEGDDLKEKGVITSVFTNALIEGLKKGAADIDKDGYISHNDLYQYLSETVISRQPLQTPCMWSDIQGAIVLAKRRTVVMRQLPKSIDQEFIIKLLQEGKIEAFNTIRRDEDMPLNLRKAELSKKKLHGVDLHDVDLTEAIFVGSDLSMSNLHRAKLVGANLSGTDLRGASFAGANFTRTNLSKADLRAADLKGMVDFTEADLTNADLRAADLNGMVNFSGAILNGTDFTCSNMDKGLMNLKGAKILNAKGLEYPTANEYLEALKSYSEALSQKFKTLNTPTYQVISVEEKIKNLIKEVEDIGRPEQLNSTKKKQLSQKFMDLVAKIISILPDTSTFEILTPFNKLIELKEIVEAARLYSEGATNLKLLRYQKAIECFDKSIEIRPDHAEAWYNKAEALFYSGKYKESIPQYDKAIEIRPDYAEAWYSKGGLLKELKQYDQAKMAINKSLVFYDNILNTNPNDAEAWYNKGNALTWLDKYDEAIKCFDKAIEIVPDYAEAWYSKGIVLNNIDKYDEAIKCYDKAIEIRPDYAEAWCEKGKSLVNIDKYDEAIKCYDKAIEIVPDYAKAWKGKGDTLEILGRKKESIEHLKKARELGYT